MSQEGRTLGLLALAANQDRLFANRGSMGHVLIAYSIRPPWVLIVARDRNDETSEHVLSEDKNRLISHDSTKTIAKQFVF